MAEVIRMPKMSDTMEEGVIAKWLVKVGDVVKSGDVLAEVETDKATMDMDSYDDGTILHLVAEEGKPVPIDSIIAIIGDKGEDFQHLLSGDSDKSEAKQAEKVESAAPQEDIDTSDIDAVIVDMPLLSDTMTEGVIHKWLKKVGDKIKSGDLLAEVETDKATMEIEAYDDGTLLHIVTQEGEAAPINSPIAVIGEPGADFERLLKASANGNKKEEAASKEERKVEAPKAEISKIQEAAPTTVNSDGRILASPLAKKIASEKGFNLAEISGTGIGGRIIKADVESFVPAPKAAVAAPALAPVAVGVEGYDEIPLTQMRKAIARGLSDSQKNAADFSLTVEINMDNAMKARKVMNETSPVKISFNDIVIKAVAAALRKHPEVNASWKEDHIRQYHHIHVGMAVAMDAGLIVPVIRFADTLSMSALAATTKELGGKAKNGKLQPAEWAGNTFTVSNLGMFGIDSFNSIINNPSNESCILSVGAIKETVAVKDGQFYATNVMKLTLTCDHRVVDGAMGANFLVTLRSLIEEPYRLLV